MTAAQAGRRIHTKKNSRDPRHMRLGRTARRSERGTTTVSDTASDTANDHDAADERSVLAWLSGWGAEVAAANIRAGRERFSHDLTAFGTHADVVRGRAAVEAAQWSQVWPAIEDFVFLTDQADVMVSADRLLAVVAAPWGSTGIAEDGSRFDRPGRATVVVRRDDVGAPWVGIHTHFSLARGVPQRTHGTKQATI
jgi:ketosteroid isomerase-like protein